MEGPQLFPLATDIRAFDIGLVGALASIIYSVSSISCKTYFSWHADEGDSAAAN